MKRKPRRIPIDVATAAKVLFMSDRTCCVCRAPGKAVQIHHLDEDPGNSVAENLAVLCLECHQKTQIRGGFDRKLDAEQVLLYRTDWHRLVALRRAHETPDHSSDPDAVGAALDTIRATALAEIYRERREYELLAIHYDSISNNELRDKYVDLAIADTPTDETIFFLRRLQDRMDLVPREISDRLLKRFGEIGDRTQIARFFRDVGDDVAAVREYLGVVLQALDEENTFTAAFYLKEASTLVPNLFVQALEEARQKKELWWQVRAMQELEWHTQLHELLLRNRRRIERSDDIQLKKLLAQELGDYAAALRLEQEEARTESLKGFDGTIGSDAGDRDEDGEPTNR